MLDPGNQGQSSNQGNQGNQGFPFYYREAVSSQSPGLLQTWVRQPNVESTPTGLRPRILVNRVLHADATALR